MMPLSGLGGRASVMFSSIMVRGVREGLEWMEWGLLKG